MAANSRNSAFHLHKSTKKLHKATENTVPIEVKIDLPAYHTQSGEAWGQNEVPGSRKLTVHTREPMGIKVIRSRWFPGGHLTGLHPGHRALGYWAAEDGGASQGDNGRQLTGSQCDRSEGRWGHQQHGE